MVVIDEVLGLRLFRVACTIMHNIFLKDVQNDLHAIILYKGHDDVLEINEEF